jgi:hypothetical protein
MELLSRRAILASILLVISWSTMAGSVVLPSFRLDPSNVKITLDPSDGSWMASNVNGKMADVSGNYRVDGDDLVLSSGGLGAAVDVTIYGGAKASPGDEGTVDCAACSDTHQKWHRLADL